MGDTLKLGIIGAGRIGRVHAENLAFRIPEAELLVVADPREEAARACAAACRIPDATGSARAVLENPAVEAVVICSPTDTHARLIEEAAAAGKHVFCEKPIDFDLARIDRTLAAVERAGVALQIGFNRRFDAHFRRARAAVEQGEVGEVHLLHITSRDPSPPPLEYVRSSGGLFLDMTIHDFDMARFLVGAEVEEVYTRAAVRVDPAIGAAGDVDTAVVVLAFANGVIGTIDNSRRAVYGYDQRVEIFGSRGSIRTENAYPNQALLATAESVRRDLPLHFFIERYAESFAAELRAFVDAVRSGTPPPVSGADGRAPVVMGLAARRSHDERRPVRLDEVDTVRRSAT